MHLAMHGKQRPDYFPLSSMCKSPFFIIYFLKQGLPLIFAHVAYRIRCQSGEFGHCIRNIPEMLPTPDGHMKIGTHSSIFCPLFAFSRLQSLKLPDPLLMSSLYPESTSKAAAFRFRLMLPCDVSTWSIPYTISEKWYYFREILYWLNTKLIGKSRRSFKWTTAQYREDRLLFWYKKCDLNTILRKIRRDA